MQKPLIALSTLGLMAAFAAPCRADYGPASSVKTIRAAEIARWRAGCHGSASCLKQKMYVNTVVIVGNYALAEWGVGEEGGGETLLHYTGGRWQRTGYTNGGVMDASELVRDGTPAATAQKLTGLIRDGR